MTFNPQTGLTESDSLETQEWLDALQSVIENEGTERAHFLLEAMIDQARRIWKQLTL
jgi:pyruvate dehydrogenase E1 component